MKDRRRASIFVDQLENRALLSGTPSAAVTADLAKIKTDTKALQAEIKTLAPTLRTDNQALHTAIQAAEATTPVQTAQATLKSDVKANNAKIAGDYKAIFNAANSTARKAAITQLKTDLANVATTYKNDAAAVQAAINADPGVAAAQAKLKTDSAPITADEATLQGDYKQLATDLKAERSTSNG